MSDIKKDDGRLRSPLPAGPLRVFIFVLWGVALYGAVVMVTTYAAVDHIGLDAHAYWDGSRRSETYSIAPGHRDAYLYSPAFLQLISPVSWLPWRGFLAVWMIIQTACFWWLTRPLGLWWQVPVMLLCLSEILYGNIHGILGVVLCLGLRRPGLWGFAILTKVSFGAVGIVWFLARREWKALAEIGVVTVGVALLSAAFDLAAWKQWVEFLTTTGDQESHTSRVLRLVAVVAVVTFAARTDRPWVLPAATLAAAPRFSLHIKDLSLMAATVRLWLSRRAVPARGGRPPRRRVGRTP